MITWHCANIDDIGKNEPSDIGVNFCRRTEYVVVDGDLEVPIVIKHDEKNQVTKIVVDEKEEVIRGKALSDNSLFPLSFKHEARDWDLEFDIDDQVKRFNMKLNNRVFFDLPDESLILRKL